MEYISATATTASLSVACGGLFYISYNRTTTTIAGALVTRENHVLATTVPFSVSAAAVPATSSFTGSRTTIKTFTSFQQKCEARGGPAFRPLQSFYCCLNSFTLYHLALCRV